MSHLPTKIDQYAFPLMITIVSIILFLFEPSSSDLLAYTRVDIDTQMYRALTGHLLHTNDIHLAFNLIGFWLLWALHGDYYKTKQLTLLFLCLCITSSLAMYFLSPNLSAYVGLSGVLHGIFAWGVVLDVAKKMLTGYLLLLGLILKVGNEQIYGAGSMMPSLIEARVATDSHLYGAISGLIFGLIWFLYYRKTAHKST